MLLNRLEYAMMNNPVRRLLQRRVEAPLLRRMGRPLGGGVALEIGCGQGVGLCLAVETFGASRVDGFDLDRRMVRLARTRLARHGTLARLWVGNAREIAAPDNSYDAVFVYGILHHVGPWRTALAEVARVLKPGGRLYAEEILSRIIRAPVVRQVLHHPQTDRFDAATFRSAMMETGLRCVAERELWGSIAWFIGDKPRATPERRRT